MISLLSLSRSVSVLFEMETLGMPRVRGVRAPVLISITNSRLSFQKLDAHDAAAFCSTDEGRSATVTTNRLRSRCRFPPPSVAGSSMQASRGRTVACGDKCASDDDCVDMPQDRSSCVVQDASWSSCINWIIYPVLNPDGYVHSWTTNRYWRKNMNPNTEVENPDACAGVDLNRNYDAEWMHGGTSTNPCSTIYGGTEPFSEPESQGTNPNTNLIFLTDIFSYFSAVLEIY